MVNIVTMMILPLVIAFGLGVASARYAISEFSGLDTVEASGWVAQPKTGTEESDPYSRARIARDAQIPLGGAEGLPFFASRDSSGEPLLLSCRYQVEGNVPTARLWTIYAVSDTAGIVTHPARRVSALHSRQLVRKQDNSFVIRAGPVPEPGNWLALSGSGKFRLVLTLYDSPIAKRSDISVIKLPQVSKIACV